MSNTTVQPSYDSIQKRGYLRYRWDRVFEKAIAELKSIMASLSETYDNLPVTEAIVERNTQLVRLLTCILGEDNLGNDFDTAVEEAVAEVTLIRASCANSRAGWPELAKLLRVIIGKETSCADVTKAIDTHKTLQDDLKHCQMANEQYQTELTKLHAEIRKLTVEKEALHLAIISKSAKQELTIGSFPNN